MTTTETTTQKTRQDIDTTPKLYPISASDPLSPDVEGSGESPEFVVDKELDPRYQLAKIHRDKGTTVRQICAKCGISMSTYYEWFPRPKHTGEVKAVGDVVREIQKMRLTMNDAEIARHFKRSRQWVWSLAGPRTASINDEKTSVIWNTTRQKRYNVEKVARKVGAAQEERTASIVTMLDMIATGELIVTAPRRRRQKFPKESE